MLNYNEEGEGKGEGNVVYFLSFFFFFFFSFRKSAVGTAMAFRPQKSLRRQFIEVGTWNSLVTPHVIGARQDMKLT